MALDNILSKVRGLVQKAEHPTTSPEEAAACREAADRLMLKYAIDQATLRESMPAAEQIKPGKIEIDICDAGSPYELNFINLISVICEHTRTQVVFRAAQVDASLAAEWTRYYGKPLQVTAQVYGFEGDLKYFEILYTTLLLHMSNGIDPQFDPAKPDTDNAYDLHTSGLNWLEIARQALKFGHEHGWDGNPDTYHQHGGYWKRQYRKALRARDEEFIHHPARFTDEQRKGWRINFAQSYVSTIRRRLAMARMGRQVGGELVLKSAMTAIQDMLNAEHPGMGSLDMNQDVEYNSKAWSAGSNHAHTADLGGNPLVRKVAGEL